MKQFDAIVIGTGQSGPSMAKDLARAGKKTAIIERKRFGGTCVNVGCIPTKTLIASARAAHVARRAGDFGVVIDSPIRVDMKRVKTRKDAVVRVSNEGVENSLKETPNITVYEGHGRFEGAHTVRVNRRARLYPGHARSRRSQLPDELEHDGRGLLTRAPHHRRRQLYRSRIRANVPPLRQPCHGGREGRTFDQPG